MDDGANCSDSSHSSDEPLMFVEAKMSPPAPEQNASKAPDGYESYFRVCRRLLKYKKGKPSTHLEQALANYANLINTANNQLSADLSRAKLNVESKEQVLDNEEMSLLACQQEFVDASNAIIQKIVNFMAPSLKTPDDFRLTRIDATNLMVSRDGVAGAEQKVKAAEAQLNDAVKEFDVVQERVDMSRMLVLSRSSIEATLDAGNSSSDNK
ncbi:hypothetical protein IWW49_000984 [Coemansia sp. RSA 1797]|nr:hypothetical protein GGH97_005610 [Coemansia sp. RSA 475]KAJ2253457.1 hypothetical protein GGH98_002650 [Coemansia sp. RSA 454]KAJ2551301.1 hypothetical protein IWW35_002882 [Coemansia sp. RSA 1878]KAJ2592523.1 hypothetical protein IWW49_000984 [Coemansia sp. RSA 1797]